MEHGFDSRRRYKKANTVKIGAKTHASHTLSFLEHEFDSVGATNSMSQSIKDDKFEIMALSSSG